MGELYAQSLVGHLICRCCGYLAIGGCDSGFMELEVVRKRAEKIPNGSPSSNSLDDEFRLTPDWNFTCNGSITSVLLGADIQEGMSLHPQVQIWRRISSIINEFNKVDSREITLDVGNFTPCGLFRYRLTPPVQFQSGDVLGVFQPSQEDSLVRLYYNSNDDSAPVVYRLGYNTSTINIDTTGGVTIRTGEYILLSLVTGMCRNSSNVFSILY